MSNEIRENYLPSTVIFQRAQLPPSRKDVKLGHRVKPGLTVSAIDRIGINGDALALASHGGNRFTKVLSLKTGNCNLKCRNTLEKNPFVALSNSHFLITADLNWFQFQIHNIRTGKSLKRIDFPYSIQAFCFSCDGNRLYTISSLSLFKEWDLATGQLINEHRLTCYPTPITQIGVDEKGNSFFTCCTDFDTIFQHDLKSGSIINQFKGTTPMIYYFKLFPEDKFLAIRGIENNIDIISLETGDVKQTISCFEFYSNLIYISKDSRRLISLIRNGTNILVWDVEKKSSRHFCSKHIHKPFAARFINENIVVAIDVTEKHKLLFIELDADRLMGVLHNFQNGFLWETVPDPDHAEDEILFWGENVENLIDVAELDAQGNLKDASLDLKDSRRDAYIKDHLDQEAVMAKLRNKTDEALFPRQLYHQVKQLTMNQLEDNLFAKARHSGQVKEE